MAISIGLVHDTLYNAGAGISAQSAMLTPGAVGRYQVSIQLPITLPPSQVYGLRYYWRYCSSGPVGSFNCTPFSVGLQSFDNPGPFNIHVVSP